MNLIWNRYTRNTVVRLLKFLPIKRGQVMCLCWNGEKYACNPKAITEAIVGNSDWAEKLHVFFALKDPNQYLSEFPFAASAVMIGSLEYYKLLATSQFIISNIHCSGAFFPYKKHGQIYIFTGHGSSGIKKIEHDADGLSSDYLRQADKDVKRIDLFLSCSAFRSKIIRSAYQYKGEILEAGTPRNDIFFKHKSAEFENRAGKHYLVYAPTFRNNGRKDVYGFDVDKVISALETRFGGEWFIRISSHPNMRDYYREIYDFSHARVIDIGNEDLQPLLLMSDALITDYSSAEMDFTLRTTVTAYRQAFPVFQLCRDRHDYDRGFYINPEDLPFPYATTDAELIHNILSFDEEKYLRELERFNRDVIGLCETGHAAEAVVRWMEERVK